MFFTTHGNLSVLSVLCSISARKSDVVSSSTPGIEFLGLKKKPLLSHIVTDRYIRVSLTLRKIHCAPCECGKRPPCMQ